jgi:hypothetical protein
MRGNPEMAEEKEGAGDASTETLEVVEEKEEVFAIAIFVDLF